MVNIVNTNTHIEVIKEVLHKEANAILELKENINLNITRIIDIILECKGRLIITGVGKSGLIGRKIAATLASTGTPTLFLHPAEGLHGDLGMVTKEDIVIAISNSGESDEVIKIIPSIRRIGARLIGFVGNSKSTLAERSDNVIYIGEVKEACPLGLTPTTSTTLTLALGDAIAIALLKARNFSEENFAVFHPGGAIGKRLLLTINDVVESTNKNPKIVNSSLVKDAIFYMTKSGIGAVSIVNHENRLVGILTDGDIRRALTRGNDILNKPVKELYNVSPITVGPNLLAVEALRIMEDKNINVLPVINENNQPIAMIQLRDLTSLGL